MAVVMKTFFPQMIGEEKPRPGMAVFQSTFFVSLHSLGRFFSLDTPWLSGPRHCAQFVLSPPALVFAGPENPKTRVQLSKE
jgi:hypothetical protein